MVSAGGPQSPLVQRTGNVLTLVAASRPRSAAGSDASRHLRPREVTQTRSGSERTPATHSVAGAGRSVAADEILLADVGAGFAQDVVGGGAVEEHVGQHEVQQVRLTFEVHLAAAHLQVDGAGLAAVDLLGGEALHVGDRTLDAVVH